MRTSTSGAGARRLISRTNLKWFALIAIAIVAVSALLLLQGDVAVHAAPGHIPFALLCDYYEHGTEHAPPRDPSGAMQRRENFYRTPPDPIDALCRDLRTRDADDQLRSRLLQWQSRFIAGDPGCVSDSAARDLAGLAEASSASDLTLLEAGRGFNWLAGDQFAAQFYKVSIRRAFRDRSDLKPGDPSCLPYLRELDQTRALWNLKDYEGLELRFRFARRFNLPLSVESRRAGCLLVDALYYQNRVDEALATIMQVQSENQRVGDLGVLDRSDIYEMNYLQGYLLHAAGHYDAAVVYLTKVRATGEHAETAANCLFRSYMELERFDDAKAALDDYVRRFHLSQAAQKSLRVDLDQARQAAAGRNAIAQALDD